MAGGKVITGTLVKISDKTATMRLPEDSPLLEGKNTSRKNYDCRYVKFDKIVVPAERLYKNYQDSLKKSYEKKNEKEQKAEQSAAKKPRTKEPSYERGM